MVGVPAVSGIDLVQSWFRQSGVRSTQPAICPLPANFSKRSQNMLNPEFLLTALVVVLIPGTGVVYTINTGLTFKWRASIAAAIGCTLGIVPHILASILGLSALLNINAQTFSVLKIAGSAYLLYLAWNMWREARTLEINRKSAETN